MKTEKWIGIIGLSVLVSFSAAGSPAVFAKGAWIDTAEYTAESEDSDALVRGAEKAMAKPIPKLADKTQAAPTGDKRDYISLAIYWWPDPDNPDGPYVRHDGKINPEKSDASHYDAPRLQQMTKLVRSLARGYAASGDERYAKRAAEILRVWFVDPATRMNPDLRYAQTIPGREKGNHNGIIDTVSLIDVVDSLYLLEPSASFPEEEQKAVKAWFSDYVDWLTKSELGRQEAAAKNNHGVWYDAQTAVYAHYVGRDDLARQIIAAVPEKRMEPQIAADGSLPLELARTRPMNYSMYVLRAYLTLARVGDELGLNLYDAQTKNGASLAKACEYILPYVSGEKTYEKPDITPFHVKQFFAAIRLAQQTHPGFLTGITLP